MKTDVSVAGELGGKVVFEEQMAYVGNLMPVLSNAFYFWQNQACFY